MSEAVRYHRTWISGVTERYGLCPCGWVGPGRRRRGMAVADAWVHRLTHCHQPVTDTEQP